MWVAGEAGTIAHFDGTRWDLRRSGPNSARYFAVGTRTQGDVWIAGEVDGKTEVIHFDGKDWARSYPFAGSSFGGFSRGPGGRLFAFMSGTNDVSIFELSQAGAWERTDTSDNFSGYTVDVWTATSGEAWALTEGAEILHLAAGAKHWEVQAPVTPTGSTGLALGGAGAQMCALYTILGGGTGYLWYDGAWHTGASATWTLPIDTTRYGARLACLSDGSGLMTYGGDVVVASPRDEPKFWPTASHAKRLFGAWSIDGARAYAVGAFGAFMTRIAGASAWQDEGPTYRRDLLAVDVGVDGAAIAASKVDPDRSVGEVVFPSDGVLGPYAGGGLNGPVTPVAVTIIDEKDAWALTNDNAQVGVTRWTGRWGVTRALSTNGVAAREPQTIWAPAHEDVWASARNAIWHYESGSWREIPVDATYRSIHGSGPNDVWFAGDGVAHWDGTLLTRIASLTSRFTGVWSSTPGRVWLWGEGGAVLFDGKGSAPVGSALHASADWDVRGIAETTSGDVFVLTKKGVGTQLLWFDPTHEKLVDVVSSDLELTAIRGRGERFAAVGQGGAFLRFAPTTLH